MISKIEDFWSVRPTKKYSQNKDLDEIKLSFENMYCLTKIGIPEIENDYYSFFPVDNLQCFSIENNSYLILGSTYEKISTLSNEIPVILVNKSNNKVFLYSESLFNIGFIPHRISFVNENLSNFLFFHMEFLKLIEKIFFNHVLLDTNTIQKMLRHLVNDLMELDSFGLGWDIDDRLFWRKILQRIIGDIEEKVNEFILLETLFTNPPKYHSR